MKNHIKTKRVKICFKKDGKGGHPHILLFRTGKNYITIGITHSSLNGRKHNYPLEINPLGGSEQSYMQKRAVVTSPISFHGKLRNGKLTINDYQVAIKYAKKKLKSERQKKKADPKQIN